MAGPLHAILLVSLIAVTVAVVTRTFSKPSLKRTLLSVLAGVSSAFGAALAAMHMCTLGQPVQQWVIPGVCMVLSLTLIGHATARRILAAVSVIMAFALSFHFAAEVHGSTYVGTISVDEHHRVGPVRSEWHSCISGLYRRGSANTSSR